MISEKRLLFKNMFVGPLSTTSRVPSSPITLERGQTSLKPFSPKLGSSHKNV